MQNHPILFQISEDIRKYADKVQGGMKTVFALLVLILGLLGYSVYLTNDFWQTRFAWQPPYAIIPFAAVIAGVLVYLSLVIYRARQPRFEIGELVADDSPGSHSFHMRFKNLGPGSHKPTVKITELRDKDGYHIPNVPESYAPEEAHWRGATEPNFQPELFKGESRYAGVLDVEGKDTDSPYLCTYPKALCAARRLWPEPIVLEQQQAIQIAVLASYRSSQDVRITERYYLIIPDKDAPLKYRAVRVKSLVLRS